MVPAGTEKKLLLIGNPNVGKSVIFRLLTGSYVLVSNFPGTTVEISRGKVQIAGTTYQVIDSPGTNSLVPQSEDERITAEILLQERPDVVVQVADAKNLRRTLLLTSQLVEFRIPMVLVLNMMDEAEERGIEIDTRGLSEQFTVPVIEMVAIYSKGRKQLINAIQSAPCPRNPVDPVLEAAADSASFPASLALEWIGLGDKALIKALSASHGEGTVDRLKSIYETYRTETRRALAREVAERRAEFLDRAVELFKKKRETRYVEETSRAGQKVWLGLLVFGLLFFLYNEVGPLFGLATPYSSLLNSLNRWQEGLHNSSRATDGFLRTLFFGIHSSGQYQYGVFQEMLHLLFLIAPVIVPFAALLRRSRNFAREFGVLTRRPLTGVPILMVGLMLVFEFVGYTGAQTFVGIIEKTIFGEVLVPHFRNLLPAGFLAEFLTGKYGLVSMGLSYAIGIVLPVVGTFFIAFGLLEDSGYIPRLSILADRIMRAIGLNGKATLPMVLGLGCVTMATMTTRILNSRKERFIATLLLALGVPCSAQLGVVMGIAAAFSYQATLTVFGVVLMQLFLVGFLASRLVRGRPSEFIFEIPPIRVPQLRNVGLKTLHRILWYLREAVPLFLYGTLTLFLMDKMTVGGKTLLVWTETVLEPVLTGILHLPAQAAPAFVLGFLRRDYGAAGLFELVRTGAFSAQQAVVALVVITLFVPCVASFLIMGKEQGIKKAAAITAFIVPFAITVGGIVGWILRTFAITFH
jgi:ferrous iron transport protein B